MEGQKELSDVSGGGEEKSLLMEESRVPKSRLCRKEREQRRKGERKRKYGITTIVCVYVIRGEGR